MSTMVLQRPVMARRSPAWLTRRGWTVLAVAICLALGVAYFAGTVRSGVQVYVPTESVVVHQGDTLWSIASARTAPGGDVRHTLALIESLNQLKGAGLVAGDLLWVPPAP